MGRGTLGPLHVEFNVCAGGGGGPPEPTAAGLQMLVALGATPLVVEGAAGSAKVASQLATYIPPEQVAAVHAAWGAS